MYNYSLKSFNTFGVESYAKDIIFIENEDDLFNLELPEKQSYKILGEGSNVLFTKSLDETILKNNIKGIDIIEETEDDVLIKAGAGENWHKLVEWALSNNLCGIENLSLIPGSVGAAPVQNIGAYGVEIKDVLFSVEGVFLMEKKFRIFTHEECQFSYRNSVFKNNLKESFFITQVNLKLSKKYKINVQYGAIQAELTSRNIIDPTIQDISSVVIHIRNSKLPNPKILGNAGSFFKNSIITNDQFKQLKIRFPDLPSYPEGQNHVKIPSAWLIEQCGWKGVRKNDVGCYENQALVIVNYGNSTGQDILNFSREIQDSVIQKFGLKLIPEVNIW